MYSIFSHLLKVAAILAMALLSRGQEMVVEKLSSSYRPAEEKTAGFFHTGQMADLMLSGIDFNNTGGPLLFNHPGGIASDGSRLLLADRNNNRVLIWNSLPEGNVKPDLVLGQKNFTANTPGTGLDELNWPVSVAMDGQHVLVADTLNDRILIWTSFPKRNGQPADLVLRGPTTKGRPVRGSERNQIVWPWAVWSNGEKVIVASTGAGSVLIWNRFPDHNDVPPDLILRAGGDFGTPRTIGSDGRRLVIGDHNSFRDRPGTFFWKSFPQTNDQPYDFYVRGPMGDRHGEVLWSPLVTQDGKLIALGAQLYLWNSFPENEHAKPDVVIGSRAGPRSAGFHFDGGDGSGLAVASRRLYISLSNGNRIVAFNSLPQSPEARPNFAVGSPDIQTNTLQTHVFITNPAPVSDGTSLFISSDFDRKLYVWKHLPGESGARPDFIYHLPEGPWDNDLHRGRLVLAGHQTVYLWSKPPRAGETPDRIIQGEIGGVQLRELKGVALDEERFYLADGAANRIYVWDGIPDARTPPRFSFTVTQPERLSSDGRYLAATSIGRPGGAVLVYRLDRLASGAQPIDLNARHQFNLPSGLLVSAGQLYVADTPFGRLQIWRQIEDALSGRDPDVVLGAKDLRERISEIGQDKLFWPGAVSFDGRYLWVGEFKFSGRVLRFSPSL